MSDNDRQRVVERGLRDPNRAADRECAIRLVAGMSRAPRAAAFARGFSLPSPGARICALAAARRHRQALGASCDPIVDCQGAGPGEKLTRRQAAAEIGISRQRLEKLIRQGRVPESAGRLERLKIWRANRVEAERLAAIARQRGENP